jgi:hypothetical protein
MPWSDGVLEYPNLGVLECWSIGVLECCVTPNHPSPLGFRSATSELLFALALCSLRFALCDVALCYLALTTYVFALC